MLKLTPLIEPVTVLNNPNNENSYLLMYSSFGSKNDSFFMTRYAGNQIYLQIFSQSPIASSSTSHKKTFFPLFNPSKPGKPLF